MVVCELVCEGLGWCNGGEGLSQKRGEELRSLP